MAATSQPAAARPSAGLCRHACNTNTPNQRAPYLQSGNASNAHNQFHTHTANRPPGLEFASAPEHKNIDLN
eukprot:75294-Lingulodinium_polyedra.AAC.1